MNTEKPNPGVANTPEIKQKPPEFATNDDGGVVLRVTSEEQIGDLFGNTSVEFATELAFNCFQIGGSKTTSVHEGNRALGMAIEIQPRDAVEALLATQMAATHSAMMRFSMMMANTEVLQQLEFLERAVNKLGRTFTTQMEALRKHRNGGRQTVTVQHVNVEDGGQAIVGNVQAGGKREE